MARAYIAPAFLSLLMLVLILSGLVRAERSSNTQGRYILEASIRNAAVRCYAIEGAYPCDMEYIQARYGVSVDRRKYAVYYEIFADNIMPNIEVIALAEGNYE